ncbi:MAG TPA: hypothetical protein VKP03_02020 [Patescibacteria group bacterium]|nr:hypothetical protein [Patescibacteria group bacterium]
MSDAQSKIKNLYQEISENKKKKKEINSVIKEAYEKNKEYQDLSEELSRLRARKKEIELTVRSEYGSEFEQLDDLKTDIRDSEQVLSDLMWNELLKNNKVEVIDEYENKFLPEVSVKLRKAG